MRYSVRRHDTGQLPVVRARAGEGGNTEGGLGGAEVDVGENFIRAIKRTPFLRRPVADTRYLPTDI